MRQDDLVDVESVSDELYGLPLDEFTPTRAAREKQAKVSGDKDLASQIHQLAKPNLVAWLSNQLVRKHPDEIRPLLVLGAGLREATATLSGEQLRDLSRQQRQVVHALVQHARLVAHAAGRKVSGDAARGLEDTLRAALADQDAADALAAGRLTEGMHNSGFGRIGSSEERPVRRAEPTTAATSLRTREQRHRAEHEVVHAKSAADEAVTVRREAHDLLEAAEQTVTSARARVERSRRELDEAVQAESRAEKDHRGAQAAFDRAERAALDSQRRLAESTKRFDRSTR
ncbi:MAG: hypothetical protein ABI903_02975 [Actinomycetota bacterium]